MGSAWVCIEPFPPGFGPNSPGNRDSYGFWRSVGPPWHSVFRFDHCTYVLAISRQKGALVYHLLFLLLACFCSDKVGDLAWAGALANVWLVRRKRCL